MSNAKEIGAKLVELCSEGKNMEAVETLYAKDAVSVEAMEGPGFPREVSGRDAILAKGKTWYEMHEVHSSETHGPYPHGDDRFAVRFVVDITNKQSGERMQFDEVGVFEIQAGKISREEFFYG